MWVNVFLGQGLPLELAELASPEHGARAAAGAAPGVTLRVDSWRAFDQEKLTRAWDSLAKSASEPNPFYESWFLLPSLETFDPLGRVMLVALEVDRQLVGLLPLQRKRTYYGHPLPHVANWTHANTFLGLPLVMRGFESLFWQQLLDWADRHAQLSLFLHLAHIPAEGCLRQALAEVLADTRHPAAMVHHEDRAMLASDLSPEAYLAASVSQKKRKELRRQQRRLAEQGSLSVERHLDAARLIEWSREFLALEQRGWKGRKGSALASDPRTEQLFITALAGAARCGKLERLALLLDGRPIAMLANFVCAPGAFSFKTAFDEDFARYSPGVLLQSENLAMLERDTIAWTDSCAAANHPMIDHFWRERRAIERYSIGIGGMLRRKTFAQIARQETGQAPRGIA